MRPLAWAGLLLVTFALPTAAEARSARPNVLVIITDDQGYGDLSIHGNPILRTPNLDRLAREGVRLDQFYVSPVCAPTRASLMTGRYNYRTRVGDTYRGRAMMDPDEVTIAERLGDAGYRTGLFGKWHLGDCAPMRAQDQGFGTTLNLRGGGIGQPSDSPEEGGGSYFDPILWRDGREVRTEGYVSDVLTDAAIDFVRAESGEPFFAYLAFNCPHSPYQAPPDELATYQALDLAAAFLPGPGGAEPTPAALDAIARSYAMIANIDANVGRLLAALEDAGKASETLVIFLTDNGPPMARYNGGLRGRKGTVHEGGIRVPCFVRWPGRLPAESVNSTLAAHIDLAPTILAACGVPADGPAMDGHNLLPILAGDQPASSDRALFFQWHRGDVPELGRAYAARRGRFKLVRAEVAPGSQEPARSELFDLVDDPGERTDLAGGRPEVVGELDAAYRAWYRDVAGTRGFDPPRIAIGSQAENPTVLTRQDWRGAEDDRLPMTPGYWEVDVQAVGPYDITVRFEPRVGPGRIVLRCGGGELAERLEAGAATVTFEGVRLPIGPSRVSADLVLEGSAGPLGPTHIEMDRRD